MSEPILRIKHSNVADPHVEIYTDIMESTLRSLQDRIMRSDLAISDVTIMDKIISEICEGRLIQKDSDRVAFGDNKPVGKTILSKDELLHALDRTTLTLEAVLKSYSKMKKEIESRDDHIKRLEVEKKRLQRGGEQMLICPEAGTKDRCIHCIHGEQHRCGPFCLNMKSCVFCISVKEKS